MKSKQPRVRVVVYVDHDEHRLAKVNIAMLGQTISEWVRGRFRILNRTQPKRRGKA